MQAKRLTARRRAPRAKHGIVGHQRLVIVGTRRRHGADACCRTIRASTGCARRSSSSPVAAIVWFAMRGDIDGQRLAAIFVFFIAAMVFWAIFEQAGITIALFADQLTRNERSASRFRRVVPVAELAVRDHACAAVRARLAAPRAAVSRRARRNSRSGSFFLGLSFLLMVPAAMLTAEGRVSPLWLVGLFFLQTVGELLLSPVGLSTMTQLAPAALVGLVLGVWFLAAAWGNKLAGMLGSGYTSTDPAALACVLPAAGGDGRRRHAGAHRSVRLAEAAHGRGAIGADERTAITVSRVSRAVRPEACQRARERGRQTTAVLVNSPAAFRRPRRCLPCRGCYHIVSEPLIPPCASTAGLAFGTGGDCAART